MAQLSSNDFQLYNGVNPNGPTDASGATPTIKGSAGLSRIAVGINDNGNPPTGSNVAPEVRGDTGSGLSGADVLNASTKSKFVGVNPVGALFSQA